MQTFWHMRWPTDRRRWWRAVAVVGLMMMFDGGIPAAAGEAIDFQPYERALERGDAEAKVIIVYFTARWCGWCRKQQVGPFTDAANVALSRKFAWAKVDVDLEPHLAAMFKANSLPALYMLNRKGHVMDVHQGYMNTAQLEIWLTENMHKADAPGQAEAHRDRQNQIFLRIAKLAPDNLQIRDVRLVVDLLAQPQPVSRDRLVAMVAAWGTAAWPGLLSCLRDGRLAVRTVARTLLLQTANARLELDPFADAEARAAQVDAWEAWMNAQAKGSPPE